MRDEDWNKYMRFDHAAANNPVAQPGGVEGAAGGLTADLQRELAFYFGAYHDQMGHSLDAAHCRENECERIKKLLYARTATPADLAERARRAVERFNEWLVTDFRESLSTDAEEALTRIVAAEFTAEAENKSINPLDTTTT